MFPTLSRFRDFSLSQHSYLFSPPRKRMAWLNELDPPSRRFLTSHNLPQSSYLIPSNKLHFYAALSSTYLHIHNYNCIRDGGKSVADSRAPAMETSRRGLIPRPFHGDPLFHRESAKLLLAEVRSGFNTPLPPLPLIPRASDVRFNNYLHADLVL